MKSRRRAWAHLEFIFFHRVTSATSWARRERGGQREKEVNTGGMKMR